MTTTFLPPATEAVGDEILDLTDRRRVFLRTILGVEVPPDAVDAVFDLSHRADEPGVIDLR